MNSPSSKSSDCRETRREPLALDGLLSGDERRSVSVEDHLHFLRSLATDDRGVDEIDREIDDILVVDPYEVHAPSRKSDADLNRVLAILDNLESGKETTR